MDGVTEVAQSRCGLQVLGVGIGQVNIGIHSSIVANDSRIDIGEGDHSCQQDQDDDVQLLTEENTEHGVPVGISGRGNLFGFQLIMVNGLEQLILRHIQGAYIDLFICHKSITSLSP